MQWNTITIIQELLSFLRQPPSDTDNIFRFEVEVDDGKGMEVSDTLAHLKVIVGVVEW